VGYQDTVLAPLPGSIELLVSCLERLLNSYFHFLYCFFFLLLLLVLTMLSTSEQVLNVSLMSCFHSLKNPEKIVEKKKEPSFIIPPHVVKDIMKDPFTGDGSQGPSDHLYKLEARCSMFTLSGISHDDVKK
jgi:hypothetical protein